MTKYPKSLWFYMSATTISILAGLGYSSSIRAINPRISRSN